jgi:hypothetical protein
VISRAAWLGRLAAAIQVIFGAFLGGVGSLAFEPGFVPRGGILFLLFALPGMVGLIGVTQRRSTLVLAAALSCFVGAFLAFSGVTLILLIPAALFLVSAGGLAVRWRPWSAAALLGGVGRLAAAAVVVMLLVGAGAAALTVTDAGCWSQYPSGAGIRVELAPYSTGETEVPAGATVTGCTTGLISARGVGLAGLLGAGALGLALLVARRRDPAQVSGIAIHSPSATPVATNSG